MTNANVIEFYPPGLRRQLAQPPIRRTPPATEKLSVTTVTPKSPQPPIRRTPRYSTEARMTTTYRLLALIEPAAPILLTALGVLVRVAA